MSVDRIDPLADTVRQHLVDRKIIKTGYLN